MSRITQRPNAFLISSAALSALLVTGCVSTLDSSDLDEVLLRKGGSIVVVGMEQREPKSDPHVVIDVIEDASSGWHDSHRRGPYRGLVEDRYAILALPESRHGESYAVTALGSLTGGGQFPTFCRGRETPTFRIDNGDVVYVGHYYIEDISAAPSGFYGWRRSYRNHFSDARNHVQRSFPAAAKALRPAELAYRSARFGVDCH